MPASISLVGFKGQTISPLLVAHYWKSWPVATALRNVFTSEDVKGYFFLTTLPETMENVIDNLVSKDTTKYSTIESKMLDLCEKPLDMATTFTSTSAYWTQTSCCNVPTSTDLSCKECSYCKKKNFRFKSHIYAKCDHLKNKKHFFKSNNFMKQKRSYARKVQDDASTSDDNVEEIKATVFSVKRRAIKSFENTFDQALVGRSIPHRHCMATVTK